MAEMWNKINMCLPAEASQDAGVYERCGQFNTSATCVGECKMYDLSEIGPPAVHNETPPVPEGPPMFLTKDFCHPIRTAGTDLTPADWQQCINKDASECYGNCVYNLGMDLTPPD
jgi:hypothetical protein